MPKISKQSFVEKTDYVRMDLSYREAAIVKALVGGIVGTGPVRNLADGIWNQLEQIDELYGILSNSFFTSCSERNDPDIHTKNDSATINLLSSLSDKLPKD